MSRYDLESIVASRDTSLIPFIDKYQLHRNKAIHYPTFKQALTLYRTKVHKTEAGLKKLLELTYNINKGGKRRKYTLEQYIKHYRKFNH